MAIVINAKLKDLDLDLENPRLHKPANQRDVIGQLLSTGKEAEKKHLNLAKDILENGLNPTDLIIVSPASEKGRRIVYEGNRRVCAMLCIQNPDFLEGISNRLKRAFSDLNTKLLPKTITCVEMSRQDATLWIVKKHMGVNEGRGTWTWSSLQKARWDYSVTGVMNTHIAIQMIIQDDEDGMIAFEESNTTTVVRIIESALVQEYVGYYFKEKQIQSDLDENELRYRFVSIIKAVPEVRDVYTDSLAKGWVSRTFPQFKVKPVPVAVLPKSQEKSQIETVVVSATRPVYSRKTRAPKYGLDRKYLISKGSLPNIPSDTRLSDMYIELSQRLVVNEVANACAVLFRSFIELTLKEFMRSHKIHDTKEMVDKLRNTKKVELSLKEKLFASIDKLIVLYPDEKKALASAKQAISSTPLYQISDMNAFVHDPNFHPDPSGLKSTWDNLRIVFTLIFRA